MTTLKLGYTDPRTDAFGAHPVLGGPLDLNDGQTFALVSPEGLELPAPTRTVLPAGNIRTRGERAARAVYARNREARATLILGPAASGAALTSTLRTLAAWLALPPASPLTVQYQPPNGSAPVYLDVVACAHSIPTDEDAWLELQLAPIEIVFIARPGLRGDRVWLQNLCVNPGLQGWSGNPVTAFSDSFANASSYTLLFGSAPSVAANVLTIPSGAGVSFGSPAWGAINQWQVRFKWVTGLSATFVLHWINGSNRIYVTVSGTAWSLVQSIAGVAHTLASGTLALSNGTWYWLQATCFPVPTSGGAFTASDPACVQATLLNDAAGAVGSSIASLGPSPCFDTSTAYSGIAALLCAGANLQVGGAFPNVHTLSLFGPGGWHLEQFGTALGFGAWEQTPANCYPGGPVQSLGAARLDLPPSGSANVQWVNFDPIAGGNVTAPPAPSGDTVACSAWVKSANLDAGASLALILRELDASGSALRSTTLQTLTGNQGAWVQLSGSVTLGANTVYAVLCLALSNSNIVNANQSAWFDNVQLWDVTATGVPAGSMPYCELRFTQSPAQLLLSGLLGDLAAPALLQFGTRVASLPAGSTLTYAIGRAGQVKSGAQLVAPGHGYYGTALTPQATPVLDASSYGGFYAKANLDNSSGWGPRAFSPRMSEASGIFHLLTRFKSADANPTAVQVRVRGDVMQDPFYTDILIPYKNVASYYGPYSNPLGAAGVWTLADAGQLSVPPFPQPGMADPTQLYVAPNTNWVGSSGTPAEADTNWQALLPIDGSLLYGQVINPANQPSGPLTNSYLWAYLDGLLVNRASAQDGPAWAYSIESLATPNVGHAAGSGGTNGTGEMSINSSADPYLLLDPGLTLPGQSGGINQAVAVVTDSSGDVLPFYGEVLYAPLYLWPR